MRSPSEEKLTWGVCDCRAVPEERGGGVDVSDERYTGSFCLWMCSF